MIKELSGFILTCLSITAIIVGAIRWLLSVYFNQQRTLASEEKSRMDAALSSLKEAVKEHSIKIQAATVMLETTQNDLKYTNKHLYELKEDVKDYSKDTDKYIRNTEKKMSELEVITKNLSILRTPK